MADWISQFNPYAWVLSNLLIGYIGIALVIFVVGYYLLFQPNATTGGRLIFRFALSLIGVIGLVFISVWIDPTRGRMWYEFPGDVLWWRPIVRLVAYGYVSYTITSLIILLAIRKFSPHRVQRAPDENSLVKIRKR